MPVLYKHYTSVYTLGGTNLSTVYIVLTVLLTINFQNGVTIFKIQNSVIHCAIAMKFSGGTTQPMH